MPYEDEDLEMITLLKAQKEEGLEIFIHRYHPHVVFVLKNTLPKNEYSEISTLENEIYYKVWQKISLFDATKSSFKTWLETIGKNHAIDYLRKKKREVETLPIEKFQNDLESATPVSLDNFYQLIFSLAPVDQTIFYQYYVENTPIEEISDITKMKEKNIYNHLTRGRKKIRKLLTKGDL